MDKIYYLALIKFNENAKTWDDMRLVLATDVENARNMADNYYINSGDGKPAVIVIRKSII